MQNNCADLIPEAAKELSRAHLIRQVELGRFSCLDPSEALLQYYDDGVGGGSQVLQVRFESCLESAYKDSVKCLSKEEVVEWLLRNKVHLTYF